MYQIKVLEIIQKANENIKEQKQIKITGFCLIFTYIIRFILER